MEQIPGETIGETAHQHGSHLEAWGKREEGGKGSPVMYINKFQNILKVSSTVYLILFIVMTINVLVNRF